MRLLVDSGTLQTVPVKLKNYDNELNSVIEAMMRMHPDSRKTILKSVLNDLKQQRNTLK